MQSYKNLTLLFPLSGFVLKSTRLLYPMKVLGKIIVIPGKQEKPGTGYC